MIEREDAGTEGKIKTQGEVGGILRKGDLAGEKRGRESKRHP